MSDSLQNDYAKRLQQACSRYGYPLWSPEPMNTLPEPYQDDGLQIGDVGIVDERGAFNVLFNICRRKEHPLHRKHGVPDKFKDFKIEDDDLHVVDGAIPPGPIRSSGINDLGVHGREETSLAYEFYSEPSNAAGAILILPHGARSTHHTTPEQFRVLAEEGASDWYEFAKKRKRVQRLDSSLYLITGFYKALSWSLGSFDDSVATSRKITVTRTADKPNAYHLHLFSGSSRDGPSSSKHNQTVFISGFKIITDSLLQEQVVLGIMESETAWSRLDRLLKNCLSQLCGCFRRHKVRSTIRVEANPPLSQPFHPSDAIGRLLLSKTKAKVAIIHDSQWMEIMKKEESRHEDLFQEDHLEGLLTKYFTISVGSERENATVFLRSKVDGISDSVFPTIDSHDSSPKPHMSESPSPPPELDVSPPFTPELESSTPNTPESEVSSPLTSEFDYLPPHMPLLDKPWFVITRIRAQNMPFGAYRIPAGFYVLAQFNGTQRRTRAMPMRLDTSSIEWEEEIPLPSKMFDEVRFTIYASFELDPMVGSGELLYTSEPTLAEQLIGGTYLIMFSTGDSGTAAPVPSLLVTLERWYSNHLVIGPSGDDSNPGLGEPFVHEIDSGRAGLRRYHNEYRREDLEYAIQHFAKALHICPLERYRPVVLVNLANAKFMSHQANPTSTNLDEPVSLYREALKLRGAGHPDRPATLLQLAQTLLFRHERQGSDESDAKEVRELLAEPKTFSPHSYEYRAAHLVLETLRRYEVVNSGSLPELNELIERLGDGAKMPPHGYFDRPQRLINLGAALWRRFQECGKCSDLDCLLEVYEQTLQLLPGRHPDRLPCLRSLSVVLWRLSEIRGDFSYLTKLITLSEETLQLVPEGHPERPCFITCSSGYLIGMLERLGDTAVKAQKYAEATEHYSEAIVVLATLREVFL